MPNEPLVFVEIALTTDTPATLLPLLDTRTPDLDVERRRRRCLLDLELPARPRRREPRHCADQTSRRSVAPRPPAAAAVRHAVTDPGFRAWIDRELHDGGASASERELLPPSRRVLARLGDVEWETDEAIRPALLAVRALPDDHRRGSVLGAVATSTSPTEQRSIASTGWPTVAGGPESAVRAHGELPVRQRPHRRRPPRSTPRTASYPRRRPSATWLR